MSPLSRYAILFFVTPVSVILFQNCGRFTPLKTDSTHLASQAPFSTGVGADGTCVSEASPPSAGAQTLTKLEYNNVIRDLFGLTNDFAAGFNAPRYGTAGFSSESEAQVLSAAIVNDFWSAASAVTDALFAKNPNPFLTCTAGDACARNLITTLANKAFRRPAYSTEVDRIFSVYKASTNTDFAASMKLAVRAILMSPQFIFRTYDLPAGSPSQAALTDYELASRLSFFIWGSIPDAELLAAAASGTLKNPATLEAQARRLLKDSRSKYLTKSFGRQWLNMDKFDITILSSTRFPDWNESMRASMRTETETFMDNVFYGDQSIMDFVSAKYSFLDANVSKVYKISNGGAAGFVKTTLDNTRFGVLTQPAILAQNSLSDHTSPVRRGRFTLDKILCAGPGSPPANIPPLPATSGGDLTDESQIRARLEAHRTQGATCMSCHSVMDPVGLTYENYDSAGYYRTAYVNGKSVDASGKLPTGENMGSFADLAALLAADTRYPTCFTAHLMSFAEGVNMKASNNGCTVNLVKAAGVGTNKKFSDLVASIVKSNSFRMRTVKY